jgi:hypothetical protein
MILRKLKFKLPILLIKATRHHQTNAWPSCQSLNCEIKSCNDFIKRGFAAQFGERFTRRLFGWLKFLSPQFRRRDFRHTTLADKSASLQHAFGVFRNLYHSPPGCGTAFALKRILLIYLNSSRAASNREFKFKHSTSSTFCTNVLYTPLLIFFQVKTISNFSFLIRFQSSDKIQAGFYFSIFFRL